MPAEDMFHELLLTFFTAMTPVLELRGAIPVGVAAGLPPAVACAVSIVGNLVPVPFIILLTRRIFDWLRRTRTFGPRIQWLERRAHLKGRLVRKYRLAGLMILVVTATYLAITFDQMVRFSLTRRRALGLLMGMAGAQALCSMGLAALLTWVERATAPMLWKAISGAASVTLERSGQVIPELGRTAAAEAVPSLLVVDMYLEWWWYPAIVLAAIALGLIIGGVIQRFGGKGGWFLWAIWMAVIFGDSLFGGFVFLKDLVPLMVVLLAGSLVWSVWSLLHAVVKN